MKVSVIIPVFNEVESIKELYDQLKKGLEQYTPNEIIFVDDGSSDGSIEAIKKISELDDSVIFIQFHRNYGKSAALSEGFKYANGNYVVTMDADLQDDPSEIKNLINKLEEGYDLVSGWKKDRKDPLSKRLPSKLFNFVTRIVTGVRIHDFNCGLKIYKKAVVKTLELYGGRHRYIPAMAGQKRFKVTEIIVNHRPRIYGETKYGGSRLFHGLFDLISILFLSKYTQSPMYFFGKIGLFTFLTGLGIEMYVLYLKYSLGDPFAKHMALLMLGILIIVIGIQFVSIGLVGEMIANSNQDKESRVKDSHRI